MSTLGPRTALKSRKISGSLAYILAQTNVKQGTKAAPNDVAGCTLEMGADGLWTGASVGTMPKATADALVASGALASVKIGTPGNVAGTLVRYGGVGVGWSFASPRPSDLLPFRAAVAKTVAGVSDTRIMCQGDSISKGIGITSVTDHWSRRAAARLAEKAGVAVGEGFVFFDYSNSPTPISTVTKGAGWSVFGVYPVFQNGMVKANVGTATSLDILFGETVDCATVLWQTGGGNTGDLIYSWDGGSKTTITNPGGSKYKYTATKIAAPSRGTHTLNLWQGATGNASYYIAAEPGDSTTAKIRHFSSGFSGAPVKDLSDKYIAITAGGDSNADAVAAMLTDLFIIEMGTNDQNKNGAYSSGDVWIGYMGNIISHIKSRSRIMSYAILGVYDTLHGQGIIPSVQDFNRYAESVGYMNGATLINIKQRWIDYANSSTFLSDTIHPNGVGSADIGAATSDSVY